MNRYDLYWEYIFKNSFKIKTWIFLVCVVLAFVVVNILAKYIHGKPNAEVVKQFYKYPSMLLFAVGFIIILIAEITKRIRKIPDGQPVFCYHSDAISRVGMTLSFVFFPSLGWMFGALIGAAFYK